MLGLFKKKEKNADYYLTRTSELFQQVFELFAKADEHILSGPSGLYPAQRAVKKANFIFTEIIDNLKILCFDFDDIISYTPFSYFCVNVGLPLLELKAEEHFYIPEIQEAWNKMVCRSETIDLKLIIKAVVVLTKISRTNNFTNEEPKKKNHDKYNNLTKEELRASLVERRRILMEQPELKEL